MSFLLEKNVKMIVIACGTASAHAYKVLASASSVPVVEVVFPGAQTAASVTRNGKIGVIATKASVESDVYGEAISHEANKLMSHGVNTEALSNLSVYQQACPLFVSLAEEGWWDEEVTYMTARKYLEPLKQAGVDTLILGCTHYPLLTKVIGEVMGENVTLVNAGKSVASVVEQSLIKTDALAEGADGLKSFYTSDDEKLFEDLASPFLGGGRPNGTKFVSTDKYDVSKAMTEIFGAKQ